MSQIWYGIRVNDYLPKRVGEILAEKQREKGLSLRQLEEKSGVSRMSIKRILDGSSSASVDKMMDVAHALGLKAWRVIKEVEDEMREAELVLDPTLTYPTYTLAADNQWRDPELEAYGAQESP